MTTHGYHARMAQCTVKARHVPGSRAERECKVHGVGARPRSVTAAAPPSPAFISEPDVEHFADGSRAERWFVHDRLHRVGGPAVALSRRDGVVQLEQWMLDGDLHRVDGPAWVRYHPDGTVEHESWWLDGKQVPREQVVAPHLTKHFEPVSETNTGAIDMLLAQGPLSELSAEQVRLALTLYPEL